MIGNGLRKVLFHKSKSLLARGNRHVQRVGLTLIVRLVKMSRKEFVAGFTIVELLTVIAILGTITAIGIPTYSGYMNKARITKAIADITIIQKEIKLYEIDRDALPNDLADIERGNFMDPYGNPYQYHLPTGPGVGHRRKDQWDNPLNDDYDLYSTGRDGQSAQHLHNKKSHDDIVRAREGRFIGLASEF
ncbi:MAG: type II secretion system protein GspG [Desulfobacteraceae bacterium]|jgi:general secretion pathway protein G